MNTVNPEANDLPGVVTFLQAELRRRQQHDSKYSLQALATDLDVDSQFLTNVLNGKRHPNPSLLQKLEAQFALSADEIEHFRAKYNEVHLDQFQFIADWYHYAILELVATREFEPSMGWIARKLGIGLEETTEAVERLFRMGFLQEKDGRWVNASGHNTTVGNPFTARALREHQRQILLKAVTALEDTPIEERDNSGVTIAIPYDRLAEAKELIKTFRRIFADLMHSERGDNDAVYQLAVAFYPLSEKED